MHIARTVLIIIQLCVVRCVRVLESGRHEAERGSPIRVRLSTLKFDGLEFLSDDQHSEAVEKHSLAAHSAEPSIIKAFQGYNGQSAADVLVFLGTDITPTSRDKVRKGAAIAMTSNEPPSCIEMLHEFEKDRPYFLLVCTKPRLKVQKVENGTAAPEGDGHPKGTLWSLLEVTDERGQTHHMLFLGVQLSPKEKNKRPMSAAVAALVEHMENRYPDLITCAVGDFNSRLVLPPSFAQDMVVQEEISKDGVTKTYQKMEQDLIGTLVRTMSSQGGLKEMLSWDQTTYNGQTLEKKHHEIPAEVAKLKKMFFWSTDYMKLPGIHVTLPTYSRQPNRMNTISFGQEAVHDSFFFPSKLKLQAKKGNKPKVSVEVDNLNAFVKDGIFINIGWLDKIGLRGNKKQCFFCGTSVLEDVLAFDHAFLVGDVCCEF